MRVTLYYQSIRPQMTPSHQPATKPPITRHCLISFPDPHVVVVLINRPDKLNSLSVEANHELDRVFRWYDAEPSCRVAILSGVGRAFCAGADLKGSSCKKDYDADTRNP